MAHLVCAWVFPLQWFWIIITYNSEYINVIQFNSRTSQSYTQGAWNSNMSDARDRSAPKGCDIHTSHDLSSDVW